MNRTELANQYQQSIEMLTEKGYRVLQIINADGSHFYFCVHEFNVLANDPEVGNMCQGKGINIEAFLRKNTGHVNVIDFQSNFDKYMDEHPYQRVEFSTAVQWLIWGKA